MSNEATQDDYLDALLAQQPATHSEAVRLFVESHGVVLQPGEDEVTAVSRILSQALSAAAQRYEAQPDVDTADAVGGLRFAADVLAAPNNPLQQEVERERQELSAQDNAPAAR